MLYLCFAKTKVNVPFSTLTMAMFFEVKVSWMYYKILMVHNLNLHDTLRSYISAFAHNNCGAEMFRICPKYKGPT